MQKLRARVAGAGGPGRRAGVRARRRSADLPPHPTSAGPPAVADPPAVARPWRVVAAACAAAVTLLAGAAPAAADDCPNAAVRAAQGAAHLPDCRAYELVSWDNPGGTLVGVDAAVRANPGFSSADGNRLLFFATAPIGPAERGPVQVYHFADRTERGWRVAPALAPTSPDAITDTLSMTQGNPIPSADLSTFGFAIGRTLGPPNPVTAASSLYISSGVGTERWISRPEPGIAPMPVSGTVVGGTPDFSTVYFVADRRLTTQAGDDVRAGIGIYEYRDGVLRPAGVLPNGMVPPQGAAVAGDGAMVGGVEVMVKRRNQVSQDGRRLFFVATEGGATQLYVREDGARTRLLSHALGAPRTPSATGVSDFGAPGSPTSSGFAFATPDGARVLFRSRDVLAPGAERAPADEPKTYRAEVATAELTYLPEVDGVPVGLDDDASRIVFIRVDGGRRELLLWDEATGATHVIDGARSTVAQEIAWIGPSDDGATWTLQSKQPLDPRFPDVGRFTQVYRWSIGDSAPRCLSCRAGATYTDNAHLTSFSSASTEPVDGGFGGSPAWRSQIAPRAVSADGRRVFFDTPTALVDADQNGVRDVYMWEEGRGVTLLSGAGPSRWPSFFIDASADGDQVMIATPTALVPEDRDESYDIYVVRAGGGFAAAPEPGCDGDGCQLPLTPPLPAALPGSDQVGPFERGDDAIAPTPAELTVRRVAGDRTGAKLRIRASTAGTLRIGGKRVAAARRSMRARQALVVRVRLTRPARRALARRGQVRVTVRVRFVPRQGRAVRAAVKTTIKQRKR